jgi:hypothetical protein
MVGWLLPVLSGAALVVLVVRWSLRRVDSLGRAAGFPWVSAVLLLAVAGGTAVPPTLRTIEQHRLGTHVLSHEAMHLRGEFNEAKTECAALQRDAWTARMLGASPAEALGLARRYWQEVYPHLPDDYRDAGCTAGGKLDERLSEAPWR